jgi:hypothetical protein
MICLDMALKIVNIEQRVRGATMQLITMFVDY